MRRKTHLTLLAAAFALTALSGASAQQQPPPRGPSPETRAFHEALEKQHLQDLRTVLRLRADQEPALAAFVQAERLQGRGEGPAAHRGPPPVEALSTPQRLDEMAKREAQRAGERQRRADALRTFYAALSPEQRQVFDALMRLQGPRRHGGPRGPGGHGPWRNGPGDHG